MGKPPPLTVHRTGWTGSSGSPQPAVGIDAERDRLRDVLNDPSIIHNYDEVKPGGNTLVRAFRSRDHGYRVFIALNNAAGERTASRMFVQTADGRRLSVEDFQRERRASAP